MELTYIANDKIRKPKGKRRTLYADGSTQDIIKGILYADSLSSKDTAGFAAELKKLPTMEALRKLWHFARFKITYKADNGAQDIKSPAALWRDKVGDCKSLSIFIGSVLKNMGIPFVYRFASYQKGSRKATHVYVVATLDGKGNDTAHPIILDAVYHKFNNQKPYAWHKDYKPANMPEVNYIHGLPSDIPVTINGIDPNRADLGYNFYDFTPEQLDKMVLLDQVQIRKGIAQRAERLNGIGSTGGQLEELAKREAALRLSLKGYTLPKGDAFHDHVNGIGSTINGDSDKPRRKRRGFFARLWGGIKDVASKVGTGILKGVTLVPRLIIRGIMKKHLPKSAPAFLYLFVKDPALVAKLPASIQKKRKKAEKFKHFVVDALGMPERTFMGIARNGILKTWGMDPEKVIAYAAKNGKFPPKGGIHGFDDHVGFIPVGEVASGLGALIDAIVKLFKKKDADAPKLGKDDMPDATDLGGSDVPPELKSGDPKKLGTKAGDETTVTDSDADGGGGSDNAKNKGKGGNTLLWVGGGLALGFLALRSSSNN